MIVTFVGVEYKVEVQVCHVERKTEIGSDREYESSFNKGNF